jgi:hypothetical protein
MNLIQVNGTILNVDHILSAEFDGSDLALEFTNPEKSVTYSGDDAKAFWWLLCGLSHGIEATE